MYEEKPSAYVKLSLSQTSQIMGAMPFQTLSRKCPSGVYTSEVMIASPRSVVMSASRNVVDLAIDLNNGRNKSIGV